MTRLWLVRHGRAAAGWNVDPDPNLDDVGRDQALRVADRLATEARGAAVLTSPLARCRETALPIASRLGTEPVVRPQLTEIPSPEGIALAGRVEWLRAAMAGTWADLGEPWVGYRDGVVRFVASQSVDAVLVTHFVAINAVLGVVVGDDRLVVRRPDNCSVTILERDDDLTLRLVEDGREADTLIR
jgi:broad specificity phosphatase PhoE